MFGIKVTWPVAVVVRLKETYTPVTNALSRYSQRTSDVSASIGGQQDGSNGGGLRRVRSGEQGARVGIFMVGATKAAIVALSIE